MKEKNLFKNIMIFIPKWITYFMFLMKFSPFLNTYILKNLCANCVQF